MKIVYVLDDTLDKADGVQQCVIAIGQYMRSIGHDVFYLVARTDRSDIPNIYPIASYLSMKFNGNSVRTPRPTPRKLIRETLNSINPDVIHIQMPYSPFFGARVLQEAGPCVRIVGTWHTFPDDGLVRLMHRPLEWMIGPSMRKVSATIGVSKPTADFADKIYHTNSIVIPNAVDIERFKVSETKKPNKKHLVYLGRFDERKGPMHLINALCELGKTYDLNSIQITMGGKGPDLEKCRQKANDCKIDINFTGFVAEDDKPGLLASADVTVFPSTGGEAFGISVVEAMASGESIVIAGDNPGYRSILGDKPELLFDPKDTKEFANKLISCLDMAHKDSSPIKKWLKQTAGQYDVAKVCKRLLSVYVA